MSLSGGMGGGAVTASDAPGQVLTFGWKRGTPHQEVAPVDERRIYDKLGERQDARRAKDFDLADDIMDELTQLGVGFLDDREMTWFAAAPPLDAPQNQQQGPAGLAWGPDNNLGKRAGDWSCPECGANVFASKMECYRCSCPRPGGTAGEGDGTRSLAGERAGRGAWAGASTAASDTASGRGGQGATGARRFAPFARMPSDRTEVDEEAVLALLDEREDARRRLLPNLPAVLARALRRLPPCPWRADQAASCLPCCRSAPPVCACWMQAAGRLALGRLPAACKLPPLVACHSSAAHACCHALLHPSRAQPCMPCRIRRVPCCMLHARVSRPRLSVCLCVVVPGEKDMGA